MAYSIKAEKHEVDFLIGLKEIKGECFFSAQPFLMEGLS